MKTIAIIPARGGSKRLPGKNLLLLGGIPLLCHSINYAKANSAIIDDVYVSTDDPSIREAALKFGAKVIDRPSGISGDSEPTISSLQHVLELLTDIENVVLLQPTNPLRPENLLRECFEKFKGTNSDSLFTVSRSHQKFGKIINSKFVPFSYEIGQRSQDLDPLYYENGLLYITQSKTILNHKIITENAYPYVVDHIFAGVDIDTRDDFAYATYLFHNS